jgi:putative ABC transport system permease protein
VFGLIMRQGGTLALAGTVIGLGGAYAAGRVIASQVYAIHASDPITLGGALVIVAGIALGATLIPAWRASRVSPSGVLHVE